MNEHQKSRMMGIELSAELMSKIAESENMRNACPVCLASGLMEFILTKTALENGISEEMIEIIMDDLTDTIIATVRLNRKSGEPESPPSSPDKRKLN